MYSYWTNEEIELLKTKYVSSSKQELLSLLPGHSWNAIKIKAGKHKLLKQFGWTESEDEILKLLWSDGTFDELLAALPGRTLDAIKNRGNDLGVKRLHSIEYNREDWHTYFENIDTPEKAYILGFWVADGCVCVYPEKSQWIVIFSSNDLDLLKIIQANIKCPQQPKETSRKGQYALRIYSQRMAESFIKMGFDNKKSQNAKLPNISTELHSHFVRGLIDGDGSIKRTKGEGKYHLSVDLNGTELLMNQVAEILPIKTKPCKCDSVWRINVTRLKAKALAAWIYQDSEHLRLERKYQRYLDSITQTGFYA